MKFFEVKEDETLDYMKDNYDDMISKVAKELDISEDDVKSLYESQKNLVSSLLKASFVLGN